MPKAKSPKTGARKRTRAVPKLDTVALKQAADAGDPVAKLKLETYALTLVAPTIGALIREGRLGRGAYADDDLLQEGRLAIMDILARWKPETASLVTFAYQRLRGALLNYAYSMIPEEVMVSTSEELVTDDEADGPQTLGDALTYDGVRSGLEAPGADDAVDDILERLGRLPAGQREAISLHYLQDLNLRDTAKRMGLTHPQQAKRLVDAAVTTLRSRSK